MDQIKWAIYDTVLWRSLRFIHFTQYCYGKEM